MTNVLLHELSHTLGLDYVAGAKDLTVRKALKELDGAVDATLTTGTTMDRALSRARRTRTPTAIHP